MVNLFEVWNDWKASISNNFIEYNNNTEFSRKRHIEKLYDEVKNTIFDKSNATEEEKEYLMQFFNWAYWTAKAKFQNITRNTWWRYFDHLIRVTHLMLQKSTSPSLAKVLISMYHDIIEDTDISFFWIEETHGCSKVALWVELLSKDPFSNFIVPFSDDYKLFESIKQAWADHNKWILNRKNLLSDNFLLRKQNHKKKYWENRLSWDEYNKLDWQEKEKHISPDEWVAYDNYRLLEKNPEYKNRRNEAFFWHMTDLETFYKHAKEISEKYGLRYTDKRIFKICLESLEVKFWDRIDNLQTSEIYHEWNKKNLEKAYRKIKETEKYFYNISKETHPYIHKYIIKEVENLKDFINKWLETTVSDTKLNVVELIK